MADADVKPQKAGLFASSAFVTLAVSVRANREQIVEAYDARLFERVPEPELDRARSRLTLVRDRLAEELRFLSDITPARARDVLAELNGTPEIVDALAAGLPNLSRINAYGDLLARNGARFLVHASHAHREFDPQAAREAIDQTRAASGFAAVADAAWTKEIATFQDDHARLIFDALREAADVPGTLTNLLEAREGASEWQAQLLSKIVDHYDRWSEPKLVRIEEDLDRSLAEIRADASNRDALEAIENGLSEWDIVNQPVQLRDEAKGLDEPKSKRVFNKVRSLAIWLANDCDQYESALAIARALERTFPELPSVVAQLSEDLATLQSLVQASRSQKLAQPLADAAQRAKADLSATGRDTVAGKFSSDGRGIAGDLYREHFAAAALASKLTPPDLPWHWTRSVALDLNNEGAQPHAAEIILKAILPDAPDAIAARIREDLATLNGLKLQKECHEALQRKDLKTARALARRIIEEVPAERDDYGKLAIVLDRRLAQRRRNYWFWGILAGIVGVIALSDSGSHSSMSDSTRYDPTLANLSEEAAQGGSPSELQEAAPDDDGTENPPPPGNFEPLSLSQLRYCKFQERRLELLKDRVPYSAYPQFNTSVDDWNSRCNNSQFLRSYGETIDSEVARNESQIQAEAARILREWSPALMFTPTPSTSLESQPDENLSTWQPSVSDPVVSSGQDENSGV